MKKWGVLLLIVVQLFSTTELHQLSKMVVLAQHYKEHKQQNADITLTQFIVMHYFSGSIPDEDHERDKQLPFKHIGAECFSFISILPPLFVTYSNLGCKPANLLLLTDKSDLTGYVSNFILADYLSYIWRPPIL